MLYSSRYYQSPGDLDLIRTRLFRVYFNLIGSLQSENKCWQSVNPAHAYFWYERSKRKWLTKTRWREGSRLTWSNLMLLWGKKKQLISHGCWAPLYQRIEGFLLASFLSTRTFLWLKKRWLKQHFILLAIKYYRHLGIQSSALIGAILIRHLAIMIPTTT